MMTVVNALISFGLRILYLPWYRIWDWIPPFRAPKSIIALYFLSYPFLAVVPFFPRRTYEKLPYWVCHSFIHFFSFVVIHFTLLSKSHSIASVIVTFLGTTYWYLHTWKSSIYSPTPTKCREAYRSPRIERARSSFSTGAIIGNSKEPGIRSSPNSHIFFCKHDRDRVIFLTATISTYFRRTPTGD